MQASHHCLLSHGLASEAMRAIRPKLDVGIVLNLSPVYAASEAASDQELAAREDGFLVRWYMDALFKGAYPEDMLGFLKDQAPRTQEGDAAIIRQRLDFLGVNYYHPIISTPSRPFSPTREGVQVTDMGWEVAPTSFTELLLRLDRDYELPPLYITENGAAYRDTVIEGGVRDEERRAYIESHVGAVADAVDQGVDVRGYFVWSLLDNFEWAAGYTKRFGIYYVDYPTQARILKRSGFWFKNLAAEFQRNHTPLAAKPRH
jgi:beta-glucosidase